MLKARRENQKPSTNSERASNTISWLVLDKARLGITGYLIIGRWLQHGLSVPLEEKGGTCNRTVQLSESSLRLETRAGCTMIRSAETSPRERIHLHRDVIGSRSIPRKVAEFENVLVDIILGLVEGANEVIKVRSQHRSSRLT